MTKLINSFLIVCICCLQGITGQSIEIYFTTCQLTYTVGEKIHVEAFVNTTGTDEFDWPLDNIELYSYIGSVKEILCTVDIANDGCGEPSTSMCGYCARQDENGYTLYFEISLSSLYSLTINWQGRTDSVENYLHYEYYPVGDVLSRYWEVGLNFTYKNTSRKLVLNSDIQHAYYVYNDFYSAEFFGTKSGNFANRNVYFYYQPAASVNEDIILVKRKPNCQVVCPSLGKLGVLNIEMTAQETGINRFNVTLHNISSVDFWTFMISLNGFSFSSSPNEIVNGTLTFSVDASTYQHFLKDNITMYFVYMMSRCNITFDGKTNPAAITP